MVLCIANMFLCVADVTSPQAHTRLRHMMHAWWLSILLAACSFVCFGFTVGFPLYQRWLIGTYMALQGLHLRVSEFVSCLV